MLLPRRNGRGFRAGHGERARAGCEGRSEVTRAEILEAVKEGLILLGIFVVVLFA